MKPIISPSVIDKFENVIQDRNCASIRAMSQERGIRDRCVDRIYAGDNDQSGSCLSQTRSIRDNR